MQWSFNIGTIFGIPVRLHITFLMLMFFIGSKSITNLILVGLVFFCVLLHELGHSLVAIKYGIRVEGITLLPIGGVASMRSLPQSPRVEFLMAAAGPAVSIAIGILFGVAALSFNQQMWPFELLGGENRVPLLGTVATINFVLAGFNLIPAFPMDGGRILRSILWSRKGFLRATTLAVKIGKGLAIVFLITSLIHFNLWLIFIAVFIYMGATAEGQAAVMKSHLANILVSQAMQTDLKLITPETTIEQAAILMTQTDQKNFPVFNGNEPAGILTRSDIYRAVQEQKFDRPASEFMTRELIYCTPLDNLGSVLHVMDKRDLTCVLVMEDHTIVGLVTPEQLRLSVARPTH